jgi:hypothetical protein
MQILSLRDVINELEYYEDIDIIIDENISIVVSNGMYKIENTFSTNHVSQIENKNMLIQHVRNMFNTLRKQTEDFLCKISY